MKNRSAAQKIISALRLEAGDTVIEIGPGRGALTFPLARECKKIGCRITAIEKDPALAHWLLGTFANWKNVIEIIHGDALRTLPQPPRPWTLVGNIPYYITGKLLRTIGELTEKPRLAVLMLQREVAERITARPPKMNLLAAATRIWADARIIAHLKPSDFTPPPKVHSSVVELTPRRITRGEGNPPHYYQFIKILFKQPRKTVFNNLRSEFKRNERELRALLRRCGMTGSERPQDLPLALLIKLASFCGKDVLQLKED